MRRLTPLVGLVFVLLIGTAGPVMAYQGSFTSPTGNTTITENLAVTFEVERECTGTLFCNREPIPQEGEVYVNLLRGTTQVGGNIDATCAADCTNVTSAWAGPTVTPTGAPWPVGCNGSYRLRAFVDGEFIDENRLNFQQPPGLPADFVAGGEVGDVTLSWSVPSKPDVFAIAIARKTASSGAWESLTPAPEDWLAPSSSSFHDSSVTADDLPVTYRVGFLRHDGKVNGSWVDGCTDTATTLQEVIDAQSLAVAEVVATVTAPEPTSSESPSPSPSETGTEGPSPQPSEPEPSPEPTTRPTISPNQPDGNGSGARPAPPSVNVPDRPEPEIRYYGDDLGFSEELDFGDIDAVTEPPTDQPTEDDTEIVADDVNVPLTRRVLNEEAVVKPVAIGVLLLTLAMHVRRWMLAP